jgi:uncharacterized membrane protein
MIQAKFKAPILAGIVMIGLLAAAPARSEVQFCNQFETTVFVAIAYQQNKDVWVSRGWLELKPNVCAPFDTALHMSSFYFRGETDDYRDVVTGKTTNYSWGRDRQFATYTDDNFNFWNADRKLTDTTLGWFSRGPDLSEDDTVKILLKEGSWLAQRDVSR